MDSSSSIHFVCCLCRTVNFKMRNERREDARPCSALKNTFLLLLLLFLTAFCNYLFISFQWWGEHVEDVEDIYKKCWLIWLPACLPLTREGCVTCCDVFSCVVFRSIEKWWNEEGREFDGSLSFYFGLVVFSWQCFSFLPPVLFFSCLFLLLSPSRLSWSSF